MLHSDDDDWIQRYFLTKDTRIYSILWSPAVLAFTFVVYALSRMANGLLFSYMIASALIFGVLYFSNVHPPQQLFMQQNYALASDWDDPDDKKLDPDEDSSAKLNLFYPPLTKIVDQLLLYFYNDFVHCWWHPLQSEYDDDNNEFEKIIKARLNTATTNVEKTLLKQERNDIVMAIMYGLANTLIIHMRECRTFETSEIPMEAYVVKNPQSPFAQLLSRKEQHHQLRGLSNTILKRILPMDDMGAAIVSSLFKELLSTHLLENILATCSDPDFLNGWIVEYLSDDLDGLDDAYIDSALAESDGLRSLVEKATEDAMAAEQQQQQQQEQHIPTSVNKQNCSQRKLDDTLENSHNSIEIDGPMDTAANQNDNTLRKYLPFTQHSTPTSKPDPVKNMQPHLNYGLDTYNISSSTTPDGTKQQLSPIGNDQDMLKSPMIYAYGTVSFSIMDISSPQDTTNIDKSKMAYIIQIERPALEQTAGSEGGGYVITRTYNDFGAFQSLMRAKYGKRVARLNLRLPLDVTARPWLLGKKRPVIGNGGGATSVLGGTDDDNNMIAQGLEQYLNTVVADAVLGRDPLILAFLQKEQVTELGTTQHKINFAEEYKDELASYTKTTTITPLAVDTTSTPTSMGTRAMSSLFGRSSGSTPTSWSPLLWSTYGGGSTHYDSSDGVCKTARQGSISSMKSGADSMSPSWKDAEGDHEKGNGFDIKSLDSHLQQQTHEPAPSATLSRNRNTIYETGQQKPLSAMDTELLIETTYALIVEIFDLTTANNKAWMRRSLLNILREIVRRSYTELVAKKYNDYMQAYLSPNALVGWMELIKDKFWPDGIYNTNSIERTLEEKGHTRQLAKKLLVQRAIPGGVRQLIGDQNCTLAMERIWNRLQDEELNRVLILQVLERVAKPLFG